LSVVTELDIICFVWIDCNLITMNKFGDLMLTRLDRNSYPLFEDCCTIVNSENKYLVMKIEFFFI
jgi:hypothetical protein